MPPETSVDPLTPKKVAALLQDGFQFIPRDIAGTNPIIFGDDQTFIQIHRHHSNREKCELAISVKVNGRPAAHCNFTLAKNDGTFHSCATGRTGYFMIADAAMDEPLTLRFMEKNISNSPAKVLPKFFSNTPNQGGGVNHR